MDRMSDGSGLRHLGVRCARTHQGQPAARNAPAGDEDAVNDGQAGEELADLIGPAEPAPNPLLYGEIRHVLAEEADASGRRRKVAVDRVEQRRLAGAVGTEHSPPLAV